MQHADGIALRFGEGRISGVIAVALGALCVLAVLCFRYPALLTTPDLRAVYPVPLLRGVLFASLLLALAFSALSLLLSRRPGLGYAGLALCAAATLLGGAWVETPDRVAPRRGLGLDWFVLDLLVLALVFVPLERAFALVRDQRILRFGWRTDLVHFLVSHLLVQVLALLTLAPATLLFAGVVSPRLQGHVAAQPLALQFVEALAVADLAQYAVHRAFHAVPWLWRFHAIHHSSRALDWLAGSRLHLVDVVATRGLVFLALFLAGFDERALYAYLAFVSFHAVLIHANVRFRFGALDELLVTPRFHHWHHSAAPEARDRNFAVHLPWLDRLFGTRHLPPGAWPDDYGIAGRPVPEGYLTQLVDPFRRRPPG
jgi:lathosterol oxidase